MSFLDFIEKLQKKPEKDRERILAVSVIAIMALMIALWAQAVRHNFSDSGGAGGAPNPLKSLWTAAGDGFKNASEQIKSLNQ